MPVPQPAAGGGGPAGKDPGLCRGQEGRRYGPGDGNPVRPGQECQQNLAPDTVQSVSQNQRQAWWG